MYTEQLQHSIETYLAGQMDHEEQAAFEQLLRAEPAVKEYLEAHQAADKAIAHSIELDIKARLTRIDRELDTKRSHRGIDQKRSPSYRFLGFAAIAASLILLLALVAHLWINGHDSPERIAAENLVVVDRQTRGGKAGESPFTLMENAASAFRNEAYDEAVRLYRKVTEGDNLLHEPAEFNLALALLAKGNIRDAVPLLQEIALNSNHQYQDKAAAILAKLDVQG